MLVSMLKGARDRKRALTGRCVGRKTYAEQSAEMCIGEKTSALPRERPQAHIAHDCRKT